MTNSRSIKGFTLLELLFVMAILLALVATAIPQYNSYRARAFDSRALTDLRNVSIAEEAYFIDHEEYLSCTNDGCIALPGIARISNGVQVAMLAEIDGFEGQASHPRGSGKIFYWDSLEGGLTED